MKPVVYGKAPAVCRSLRTGIRPIVRCYIAPHPVEVQQEIPPEMSKEDQVSVKVIPSVPVETSAGSRATRRDSTSGEEISSASTTGTEKTYRDGLCSDTGGYTVMLMDCSAERHFLNGHRHCRVISQVF